MSSEEKNGDFIENKPNSMFLNIDIVHKCNNKTTACNDIDMRIVSEGLFELAEMVSLHE